MSTHPFAGMHQHPNNSTPCLNSLHVEPVQPASLLALALRSFARAGLKLPSAVFYQLYRKHFLLEDLHRFRRELREYEQCPRECNSLHGMTLREIFDVLDLADPL